MKKAIRKYWFLFKNLLKRNNEKVQRFKYTKRLKEYILENPVVYSPRTISLNSKGDGVDIREAGYNIDENFKFINSDIKELLYRFEQEVAASQKSIGFSEPIKEKTYRFPNNKYIEWAI